MASYSIDLLQSESYENPWTCAIRPVPIFTSPNFGRSQHQTCLAFRLHQNSLPPLTINLKQKKTMDPNSQPGTSHSRSRSLSLCNHHQLRCKVPLLNLHKRGSIPHRQLPGNSSTPLCQYLK